MPREIGNSYAMEERKKFIRDTVISDGKINRQQVIDRFKVTPATVAMDMRLTMIRWPGLMRYDLRKKAYLLLDADAGSEPGYVSAIPAAPEADAFICDVRLKSGAFNSTIQFQLDGSGIEMQRFVESWLALMLAAIRLGTSK